jgi:hypothetical protein
MDSNLPRAASSLEHAKFTQAACGLRIGSRASKTEKRHKSLVAQECPLHSRRQAITVQGESDERKATMETLLVISGAWWIDSRAPEKPAKSGR